jgi:hypothetical protein
MPSAREDYLLRMIQQLGVVLARLRGRLAGASAADLVEVEREAGAAIGKLLGPQALLGQVDANTAVRLVADADRVAMWVAFLRVRSEALRAAGRVDAADRMEARATDLEAASARGAESR